ncbi:MAG: LptF/LptG family permease [Candidatus Paracaedibacteraceae bacterium]|nr:LptF/LptG family permease [Candidatus Paracaedibacteraceae bacterium]
MTKIISRHTFLHVAITTIVLTVVLVFGAWLTQSLRFIEVIIEKDVSMTRYLSMIWLLLPNLTSIVLPVCTLLAAVYTLYKLSSENELIVFKSVGLSNLQIAKPLIVWAVFMTAFCAALNNHWGPKSNEKFYNVRGEISREFSSGLLRDGVFNRIKDTVIYIGSHTDSGQLEGVYIHERSKNEKPAVTVYAQHGFMTQEGDKNTLYLFNGNRQSGDPSQPSYNIAYFNEFKYDLDFYKNINAKVKLHTTLSFKDLLNPSQDITSGTRTKMIVEAHKRILNPFFVMIFVFFSCAVMLSGFHQRRGRWKRNVLAVGVSLAMELGVIGLLNSLTKNPYAIALSYTISLGVCIFSIIWLTNPGLISRLVRKKTTDA